MSGGVDSSVAAALLKKAGFDVAGAFMKCWDEKDTFGQCAAAEDAAMARRVAQKLGIPFYTFDFTHEYRKEVFNYFIAEYKAGRTPNPDVMCNKHIKFGLFLEKALALGFDYIATGHYVRIQNSKIKIQNENAKFKIVYKLLQAEDKNKDQSYFLWTLSQEQLRHCLFPIGEYTKPEVRELARKFGLPNAERKDSQGICFVGKVDLTDFLQNHISPKTGEITDPTGKILGNHPGIFYYTIGQRHGIGLGGGPYWVLEKRIKDNVLVVTRNEKDLCKKEVFLQDINWISGGEPPLPLRLKAAIRYRQKAEKATLTKARGSRRYTLKFDEPQRAVAPGQSVVFFGGEELLGGGTIV